VVVSIERSKARIAAGLAWLTAVACAAAMAWSPAADAGVYHVYSCSTPSGGYAPTEGWHESRVGSDVRAEDTCGSPGGALVAGLTEQPTRETNTDTASWAFEAPPGERIAGATLWRSGDADGGTTYGGASYKFWFAGPLNVESPEDAFGACEGGTQCPKGVGNSSQPLSTENAVAVPQANLGSHLYLDASCVGPPGFKCPTNPPDPNGYEAVVYLYAADIELEDATSPSVSDVSGELATASTVQGTSDVTFDATDGGSGVYEALVSVDGQVVQRVALDENGGRCVDVGSEDGVPAFLSPQPCGGSVSGDVGFDSTRVGNGAHHVVVTVTDGAGNGTVVMDRRVTVDNPAPATPGPLNGTDASGEASLKVAWVGSKKAGIVSSYGRGEAIEGRLTAPGGVGIGGAEIECSDTATYAGARSAAMACPKTGPDGRFAVKVAAGSSSRTLHFAYREHLGDVQPVAKASLSLSVRAGVRLRVRPHTASVDRRIFFTGRLLGGPVPHGGKQLVLEARSPGGRWIEFDVVRSDGKGRFLSSYRFRFPGPARYQFRALSESEADYPYAAGGSDVVGVYER
jgi:hypothetical protein